MDLTAWSGPWGVSYAINLTPDQDTGIGIWTEEMFIKAIRSGKHMGEASSRPILPRCLGRISTPEGRRAQGPVRVPEVAPPDEEPRSGPVILPPPDPSAPGAGASGATEPARPAGT
jgi:hypothetical protein